MKVIADSVRGREDGAALASPSGGRPFAGRCALLGAGLVVALACALAPGARAEEISDDGDEPALVGDQVHRSEYAVEVPSTWHVEEIFGHSVAPGDKQRLFLRASESFAGASVELPVLVARGFEAGPALCLTAGIHGDELNGIEIVRRVFEDVSPRRLRGTLIVIPVANLHGFRSTSRYLPDRRDLNRFFPGDPKGSSAARIANAIFESVIRHCSAVLDFHTGSFRRSNLPQIRADLRREGLLELARSLGVGVVVHSGGVDGTLRRAATEIGVAAITYEAGEPLRFQSEEIRRGIAGTWNLMGALGMAPRIRPREDASDASAAAVYYESRWVRADDGGIFLTDRSLGDTVRAGDELGTVTDPVSNERGSIVAPVSGRIIGMAFPQVVIPGFAAFHIGIDSPPDPVSAGIPDELHTEIDDLPADGDLEGDENPE